MKISYDPNVDALYIRLIEGKQECETITLNDSVSINIGQNERIVGIEILDASEVISELKDRKVFLENLSVG